MGNCANKPLTNEGDTPAPEEKAVETTQRELVLEQTKDEEKKPEVEILAAKPTEEKPVSEVTTQAKGVVSEPKKEETKPVEAVAKVEEKKVEAPVTKVEEKKVESPVTKVEEKKVEAPVTEKKVEEKKA